MSRLDNKKLIFFLRNAFIQAFIAWEKRQPARNGLHVASLKDEGWCTRKHVILNLFPELREDVASYWTVLSKYVHGWSIHEKWQHKLLRPTGLVALNEQGQPELDLTHYDEIRETHFSPDVILNFAGEYIPVEIKGINHNEYAGHPAYYDKAGNLLEKEIKGIAGASLEQAIQRNQSIRDGVPQLNFYMHLLRGEGKEVSRGIMLIEDKNNQDFELFPVEYDREKALPMAHRAEGVKGATVTANSRGKLPARCCTSPGDALAKSCPVRDYCFSVAE